MIAKAISYCYVCKNKFLTMDGKIAIDVFGVAAFNARKVCSQTCYRSWHARPIQDLEGNRYEPKAVPFSFPDQAPIAVPITGPAASFPRPTKRVHGNKVGESCSTEA